jgi:hypothetical protein
VWTDLGNPVTSTDTTLTFSDPDSSAPLRFYRLVLLPVD